MNINTLRFEAVDFCYEVGNPIYISPVSAKFEQNRINVITGPNGCGKTTLMNLALKMWEYKGNISINKTDIRVLKNEVVRSQIAFCFQEPAIFNDTIKSNIILNHDYDKDYFDYLLKATLLYNDIQLMSNGMDTVVNNHMLSQGQMQKISVCRALYSRKPVMIFDEPTSNLDSLSKQALTEFFQEIKKNHVIIVITHDKKLAEYADYTLQL